MKYIFRATLFLFIITSSQKICYSQAVPAPIPVWDGINLPQNIMSAVSAYEDMMTGIEQLHLLQKEFEITIQNTLAPAFWVWDTASNFEENLADFKKKFDFFGNGGIEDYLKQYLDADFYRNSPCFKLGGCSQQEMAKLKQYQRDRLEKMAKTSTMVADGVKKYLDLSKKRKRTIDALANKTKNAKGHMEAMQYNSQWSRLSLTALDDINKNLIVLQSQIMTYIDEQYGTKASQYSSSEKLGLKVMNPKIKGIKKQYKYMNLSSKIQ